MRYLFDMPKNSRTTIPADLRSHLETARLDLLAIFRALDQMDLNPSEIPQRLIHQLFELDADYAEALWALDQPIGYIDPKLMLRDTLAALHQLPSILTLFEKNLPKRVHRTFELLKTKIREKLNPSEAYNQVPGRNPQNR